MESVGWFRIGAHVRVTLHGAMDIEGNVQLVCEEGFYLSSPQDERTRDWFVGWSLFQFAELVSP